MSTNYYVKGASRPCPHCGQSAAEDLHIGKSAMGWKFMFHQYPELGLTTWKAWFDFLTGKEIVDEYDDSVSLEELVEIVKSHQTIAHLDAFNSTAAQYGPWSWEERCKNEYKDGEGYVFVTASEWS